MKNLKLKNNKIAMFSMMLFGAFLGFVMMGGLPIVQANALADIVDGVGGGVVNAAADIARTGGAKIVAVFLIALSNFQQFQDPRANKVATFVKMVITIAIVTAIMNDLRGFLNALISTFG